MQYLCQRIGEEMEKFREYNGLSGLRATKLMVKETKKLIPEHGRIGDFIKSFDTLTCDLHSDDIWLFVQYIISTNEILEDKKYAGVELKVAKDCPISCLLLVLEKLAMNFWSYSNSSNPKYFYLLKNITSKVVRIPEAGADINLEDVQGEIIDDSLSNKKVETHFSFETALVVQVEVSTLDSEIMSNPKEALKKLNDLASLNADSPQPKPSDLLANNLIVAPDRGSFSKYICSKRTL